MYILDEIYIRMKSTGLLSTLNNCQFSFIFNPSCFKKTSINFLHLCNSFLFFPNKIISSIYLK
nr:MAG TPA: hypothetical protein [Caudoviricetes sp.]